MKKLFLMTVFVSSSAFSHPDYCSDNIMQTSGISWEDCYAKGELPVRSGPNAGQCVSQAVYKGFCSNGCPFVVQSYDKKALISRAKCLIID